MSSFVDLYKWTVAGKVTRTEDFLSGCLGLAAKHDSAFATRLVRLLNPHLSAGSGGPVFVGFQDAAVHEGITAGRTDLTLEIDGHRTVVECKFGENPLSTEQLQRYRASTRPPCTVVALVETLPRVSPEGFPVSTWSQISALLEGSRDRTPWTGELLELFRYLGIASTQTLPEVGKKELKRYHKRIDALDEAVRHGLAQLFRDHARELFISETKPADGLRSWSTIDIGWGWEGEEALPGTALRGIELSARLDAARGLDWELELLPGAGASAGNLAADKTLPWELSEAGWVSARLPVVHVDHGGSLGPTVREALELSSQLLWATSSRYPALGEFPRVTPQPAANLPSLQKARTALEETAAFERAGSAIAGEMVRQVRDLIEECGHPPELNLGKVWSAHGRRPRFYIKRGRKGVAGFGVYFRETAKRGKRFKLWLWADSADRLERMRTSFSDASRLKKRHKNLLLRPEGKTAPTAESFGPIAEKLSAALLQGSK